MPSDDDQSRESDHVGRRHSDEAGVMARCQRKRTHEENINEGYAKDMRCLTYLPWGRRVGRFCTGDEELRQLPERREIPPSSRTGNK